MTMTIIVCGSLEDAATRVANAWRCAQRGERIEGMG